MDPFLNDLLGNGSDEFKTSTKTEEEIKKLTLEENMTEIKRTMHILSRGQPIQKYSIYLNLDKILIEPDAFNKVLPLVSEEILNQTEDNQIEAARSIRKLLTNKALSQTNVIQIFQITCSILKIWNQAVLDEWVLVFNEILKKIPYEAIARDCENTIMSLSEATQHSLSKYVAVRMIGFIADNGIKNTNQLFNRARILCQDPDYEIRKVLAEEVMLRICINAGTELTESKYLEKIMELLYDSNINIKLCAIDSIVKLLDILSYDYKKTRMAYVFLELMNSINEDVMKKMSFHVGTITHKLEEVIPKNSNQLLQIQNIYRDWSTSKSSEIRKNIIYNLPYMIRLYDNKDHFKALYLKAIKDTNNKALRTIAVSCFHEICKAYKAEEFPQDLREMFETLLKSTEMEVVEKLVISLDQLISVFHVKREENPDEESEKDQEEEKEKIEKDNKEKNKDTKGVRENIRESQVSYLGDFLKLAEQVKSNFAWRLEIVFMSHINKCHDYFDIKELGEKYVTYLLDRALKGQNQVQPVALDSIILFLKRNYISKRTAEVMKIVTQTFYGGLHAKDRIAFVELYAKLADNFSRKFFKTFNLNEMVVKLADDKVPDVRRKVFEHCVVIRKMLSPNETSLVAKLEDGCTRSKVDKNKRLAELARDSLKELKSLTQFFFAEFEEEDRKRMIEEDALRQREEAEEAKKRQVGGEDPQSGKGDYLYSFSSFMTGGANRKGSKKPSFKPDMMKNTKGIVFGQNSASLITPKTKPGGPPAVGLSKNSSVPGTSTSQLDDLDSKSKDPTKITRPSAKPSTFTGTTSTKKADSLTAIGSTGSGSGSKVSLSDVDKNFSLGGKPLIKDTSSKPPISSNIPKPEPKSLNGKPPASADPDKTAIKVPTIKRKI